MIDIFDKAKQGVIIATIAWCTAFAHDGLANEVDGARAIIRHDVESIQGTRLHYESYAIIHPLRPPIREDYTIEIVDKWGAGVIFSYEVRQSVLGTSTGIQSLSSLDACRSIDPWWDPAQTSFDGRCELWISPQQLRELIVEGKTYLAVDTIERKDSVVRWSFDGDVVYWVSIDGRRVALDGIRAHTSRADEFIILKNFENPLILKAKSSYFSWDLVKID